MGTLSIEIHCLLKADDVRWETIESLSLEIGYPTGNGQTHWKHIGWVQEPLHSTVKSFSHALWSRQSAGHTIVIDFMPVTKPHSGALEKTYCYRTHKMGAKGKMLSTKIKIVEGFHTSLFFSFKPCYPGAVT